ncbi:MAG TPA: AraC family transcriptional regulator [Cyclobacteriaceae bacterium]|jgi:AraC-like DNA-binding protein|nr:AraC family transcriptional regulator [Cyclobacteriaceae bacterium]
MQFLLIFCSLAAGHALFWALVLFTLNKKQSNRLLGLLLIMLALRVGKSATGIVVPGYLHFFSTVGVVSMAEIGPLLYLFTLSLFDSGFKLSAKNYWHFVPGLLVLIVMLAAQWKFLNVSYYLFTTHFFCYLLLTWNYVLKNKEQFRADDLKWKWVNYILYGISLIGITFVLQLLFYHPIVYRLIVITAASLFYFLSWWAIPRAKLFTYESKKKSDENHILEELGKRIKQLLAEEELFTDPNLTVTKLASRVKAPAYLVSKAINFYFEKSFSELLTSSRIKKAEQLLLADGNKTLTIEAIAYESGFNTLSAFYTAFKKINKITPAQFRDSHPRSNMRIA